MATFCFILLIVRAHFNVLDAYDHLPFIFLMITFHLPFSLKKKKYEKIKVRDFRKFSPGSFLEDLGEAFKNDKISQNNLNIHEHFHQFRSVLSDTLNKRAPTRLQTRKNTLLISMLPIVWTKRRNLTSGSKIRNLSP